MRADYLILALPALATAQQQIPLLDNIKGWFNAASSTVSSAASAAASHLPSNIPNPIDSGAASAAAALVHPVNLTTWKRTIRPDPSTYATSSPSSLGPEPWMVFLTGGNKTCYGMCHAISTAWNASTPLLAASPSAPKLAVIDCDADQIMCNTWSAGPPSIYYFLLPRTLPDQSRPATEAHYISLNRTTNATTVQEIVALHTEGKYKEHPEPSWAWHPFDGVMARTGLDWPLAWVMWGLAQMPSWLPMIAISFLSRTFMGRRGAAQAGRQQGGAAGGAAPAGGAPAGGR